MKHIFVYNPVAGARKAQKTILPRILAAVKEAGVDYEIHRTTNAGEATMWVRRRLRNAPKEETLRFYAVGGDGTLSEVMNGLYGFENAELACVPMGSGNDFIRNFGGEPRGAEDYPFTRIDAQLRGEATPIDVMEIQFLSVEDADGQGIEFSPEEDADGLDIEPSPKEDADEQDIEFSPDEDADGPGTVRYAINMLNIGFDANVVAHTHQLKKTRVLRGTAAYITGVVTELASYRLSRAQVQIGNNQPFDTVILLAGVGNGSFSGGGFKGLPMARVSDGLLDVYVIKPIARIEFLKLVGKYHDGTLADDTRMVGRLFQWQTRQATFTPVGQLTLAVDGETLRTAKPFRIRLADRPVRFSVPEGAFPIV